MLILHLERIGRDAGIEYDALIDPAEQRIGDPKAFLKDPNNWIPHRILRSLIHAAEFAASDQEVSYHAARDYFRLDQTHSFFEILAQVVGNVEQMLRYSNLWASSYTNYLSLQPVTATGENSFIFLSRFCPQVKPEIGNIGLIRGNYEGFVRLFDEAARGECIEEISQVALQTIVREFGGYRLIEGDDRVTVVEAASQKRIIEAEKIWLSTEVYAVIPDENGGLTDPILKGRGGKITVFAPRTETDPKRRKDETIAYQIVRGGTLISDRVTYTLDEGKLFNAPYSRFRFAWKPTIMKKGAARSLAPSGPKIVPLLFEHLRSLKETQRRLLYCAIENRALAESNASLQEEIRREDDFFGIIGKSPKMQELFDQVRRIAAADSTVLITGETGTGKELLARAIHRASPRRDQRFFPINCAALPESLLEAELFGYEKGAFTGAAAQKKGIFEAADGGTLFLDEVGEISPPMQARLLRVLEEREIQRIGGREIIPIDVRILSAANRRLEELVAEGKFRSDLFYRLNVISVTVPPLRERLEDLVLLIDHYIAFFSHKSKKPKPAIRRESLTRLAEYPWPGNIRQLKNVIERAVVLDHDGEIGPDDIVLPEEEAVFEPSGGKPTKFRDSIQHFKRSVIENALREAQGNQTQAAKRLGLQRTYLARLIRLLKIPEP